MQVENTEVKHSKLTLVWIVFPMAAIIYTSYKFLTVGAEYKNLIPSFGILTTYFVMVMMEGFFKYEKGVKQTKFLLRDVTSNMMHLFVTGMVGRLLMVPIIAFVLQESLGRGLVFAERTDAGPIWLQAIMVFLFFSFMRYCVHFYQHHNKYL